MSGSGKTVTLEYLIGQLSAEGYRVGTIKHIHIPNFTIDKEGTNSWRYAKAGSKVTVAVSPQEIAIIKKTETSPDQIDQIIESLSIEKLDIVFVEGFHSAMMKRKDIPKIITAKNQDDLEAALKNSVPPVLAITGLVAQNTDKKFEGKIPVIKVSVEGKQLLKIVKELLNNKSSSE